MLDPYQICDFVSIFSRSMNCLLFSLKHENSFSFDEVQFVCCFLLLLMLFGAIGKKPLSL